MVRVPTARPPVRKGKGLFKTGHEGPERECMYSCTLSLISALDRRWWLMPHPGRFTPWKETQCAFHRWSPESVWTRVENLVATGTRSSNCPARSESLYIPLGCQNRGPRPCMFVCVCVLTHTHTIEITYTIILAISVLIHLIFTSVVRELTHKNNCGPFHPPPKTVTPDLLDSTPFASYRVTFWEPQCYSETQH